MKCFNHLNLHLISQTFSTFAFQYVIGKGIARYIGGLEGKQLDTFPNGNGELELLFAYGGHLAYEQIWGEKFFFNYNLRSNKLRRNAINP